MSFPETRLTLIQRLASTGSERDWQNFLTDYWGPVCRFALRQGAPHLDEAEDVAALTFELLWTNALLVRWVSNRAAKLRTLLCAVVRKILSNDRRTRQRREGLAEEVIRHVEELSRSQNAAVDAFYAAWVDDLLQQALRSLAAEYCAQGKGNYLRVLHGRLCQRLSLAAVAEALRIKTTDVDNYFRHARDRLTAHLQDIVRRHVERYSSPAEAPEEFEAEWRRLGDYLLEHGGLENALGRNQSMLDPLTDELRKSRILPQTLQRVTSVMRAVEPRRDTARPSDGPAVA